MTENKRFHYRLDGVGVRYCICDGKTEDKIFAEVVGDVEEVTDKLNELNEENEQLKNLLKETVVNEVLNEIRVELTSRLNDCIEEFKE